MRSQTNELCASAMRLCEERVYTAKAARHRNAARYYAEMELIRKAWQVVLCAEWESQMRRRLAGDLPPIPSSDFEAKAEANA